MPNPDHICVGAIAGSFGVQGEVRLKSFCSDPEAIAAYGPLFSEDGKTTYKIKLTRPVAGGLGARIAGVETKEQADALKGISLYVDKKKLPHLPDDEFYHADLIGLAAVSSGGDPVGTVTGVFNHGAGDILEISPATGEPLLVPFTRETVPTIDIARGRLVLVPLPESDDDVEDQPGA